MKRIITRLLALSIITAISACGGPTNSANASKEPIQSSSSSEEKSSSSNNKSSSSILDNKDVTLTTTSGLSIKFFSTGADIDNMTFSRTKIASNSFTDGK